MSTAETPGGPRAREALLFAAARVASLAIGTGASLVLVRQMTIDEFGSFSAATGVFLLVSSLGYLGADQLLLARRLEIDRFRWLVPRIGALTMVVTIALAAAWPGLEARERLVVGLLGGTRVVDLFRGPWLFQPQLSLQHLRRALRELAAQSLLSTGLVIAVLLQASAVVVAAGGLAASALATAWVFLTNPLPVRTQGKEGRTAFEIVMSGLGFASSSILYSAINAIGLAMIPVFAAPDDVARFRAALLVYSAALVLPIAINNDVLRPHLYSTELEHDRVAPGLRGQVLTINLALAASVAAGLLLAGRFVVEPFFGADYGGVAQLLVPLAASVPFAFLSSYVANLLIVRGRLGEVVKAQLALLAVAVLVNAVLISKHEAMGGALSLLVVDVVSLGVYLAVWVAQVPRSEPAR